LVNPEDVEDSDEEPTVKNTTETNPVEMDTLDQQLPTKRADLGITHQDRGKLMHSTGTIQEMNESKEMSNGGNSSLQNSKEKLVTQVSDQNESHLTPVKKGNTDINEKPTTRKSFGDKSLKSSDKSSSSDDYVENELMDQEDGQVGTFEEVLHKMRHQNNESVPVILFQPNTNEMRRERNLLPPIASNRKYTLVLDLDETLIHFDEKEDGTSQFLIRPYAQFFLKQVAKYYEVVIFTAAL
jgi:TFIIF-interacting CTD phosphatase-like protein